MVGTVVVIAVDSGVESLGVTICFVVLTGPAGAEEERRGGRVDMLAPS
jgi:hypothetical protein